MSKAPRTDPGEARASRAEGLARDAITRVAARMSLLALATGRPLPPGLPELPPSGPTASLARLIGLRCDLDLDLRARILLALDLYAEARRLVHSHTQAVPPEALEACVGPLLELHETFSSDPVVGRLFGPDAGRAAFFGTRPGTLVEIPKAPGTGRLLLAALQPGGPSGLGLPSASPPPGSEPGTKRARTRHLGFQVPMPARLGTAVEVDINLLRAGRCVAFAEGAVAAHRKRIALLEAALEFARMGRSAAHTLATIPVQGLIRQIALAAANPELAARIEEAVRQFQAAEQALVAASRTLSHAQGLPPREARAAIGDLETERIQALVDPLIALSDSFRSHPVLARVFPPIAV